MSVARKNATNAAVNADKLRGHVRITAGSIAILYSEAVPVHATPVNIEAYATLLPIAVLNLSIKHQPFV